MPNHFNDYSQKLNFYISTTLLQKILSFTSRKGIKADSLLTRANVDKSLLDNIDNKIPLVDYYSIMDAAVDMTEDKYFGLHMGETGDPGDISILGYIMASCRSVRESIEKFNKYFGIVGSTQRISFNIERDNARILWHMIKCFPNKCLKHCNDLGLSHFYHMILNFTDRPIKLKEVWIKTEPPDDIKEYERVFNCPILFNQPVPALVFPSEVMDTPFRHYNPELLSLLERHANSIQSKIEEDCYLSRKLSMLFFESIQSHVPTIEDVAKNLGMSVRVLQHKLKEEGVTFSGVIDNVRQQLAESYLAERQYTIDDISFLVGFSEPSVFRRAFKRWTGMTASEYRASSENKFKAQAANA